MADGTKIEWTDATWNPVTGCSVVSPGCTNCYAMKLAGTRLQHHPSRAGLTRDSKAGPAWTGEVRFNEGWLTQPLRWKRPRRIFVCAHGDLFHEDVPDAWIDRVFAVITLAPQHTFQVLTKRAARMRAYLTDLKAGAPLMVPFGDGTLTQHPFNSELKPPHNVWLGVSAEDQARADERIPDLLATPAAVRFVSAEPLLGPIDLHDHLLGFAAGHPAACACGHGHGFTRCFNYGGVSPTCHYHGCTCPGFRKARGANGLHQVIVGGENGPRLMHPNWVRQLQRQCDKARVPFFFKQWGSFSYNAVLSADAHPDAVDHLCCIDSAGGNWALSKAAGEGWHALEPGRQFWAPLDDVPIDLVSWSRVGKKVAGRLLDGAEHNGVPA
jgi:protein gp37